MPVLYPSQRFLSPRYLSYVSLLALKRAFIGILVLLCIVRMRQRGPRESTTPPPEAVALLPHPLGLGDLLMISPVLAGRAFRQRVTIFSTHPPRWEHSGEWRQFSTTQDLLREAALIPAEVEILIPHHTIRTTLFALLRMHTMVTARLSEHYAISTTTRQTIRLAGAAQSYTQNVAQMFGMSSAAIPLRPPVPISAALPLNLSVRYVVVAPYAAWNSRRWPIAKWSELLVRIAHEFTLTPVIVGDAHERSYGDEICQATAPSPYQPLNFMGRTSYAELARIVRDAVAVVSVDNGIMHLTATVGTPLVALFGPTPASARLFGVTQATSCQSSLSCALAPCYASYRKVHCPFSFECMEEISVEYVFAALRAYVEPPSGQHNRTP